MVGWIDLRTWLAFNNVKPIQVPQGYLIPVEKKNWELWQLSDYAVESVAAGCVRLRVR